MPFKFKFCWISLFCSIEIYKKAYKDTSVLKRLIESSLYMSSGAFLSNGSDQNASINKVFWYRAWGICNGYFVPNFSQISLWSSDRICVGIKIFTKILEIQKSIDFNTFSRKVYLAKTKPVHHQYLKKELKNLFDF